MRHCGLAVVLAALVIGGCVSQASPSADPLLRSAYERSIALAAVKSLAYERELTPITGNEVTVVHVQSKERIDPTRYIWVAHPKELKARCEGKLDPALALQMALGLPPPSEPELKVFTLTVRAADVFRPCASSAAVTTTSCRLDVVLPYSDPDRPFVLKQMMASYRKSDGYPFTAMGWSYNWDPAAKTPMGVSEYVVRPGASLGNPTWVTAAQFCAG